MKKKFTLLELLVVVAVIGILSTILIPSVNNAVKRARQIHCMNNLKEIAVAYNIYKVDYETFPINTYFLDDFTPLYYYTDSTAVFNCKGDNDMEVTEVEHLDGETPYMRHVDFGDIADIEFTGTENEGLGNNPYGLDPSHPNFTKWIEGKFQSTGLHDKSKTHHGVYNYIDLNTNAYDPKRANTIFWTLRANRTLELTGGGGGGGGGGK